MTNRRKPKCATCELCGSAQHHTPECHLRSDITDELDLEFFAESVRDRGRWRLVSSSGKHWLQQGTVDAGVVHVRIPREFAAGMAKAGIRITSGTKGPSYRAVELLNALRRTWARAEQPTYTPGDAVDVDGSTYRITRVHRYTTDREEVLASADGDPFYPGAHCQCGVPHRTTTGLNLATGNTYSVCTYCRGIVP